MEKDTIILSVDKYNELRDFKLAIEKGNLIRLLPIFQHSQNLN